MIVAGDSRPVSAYSMGQVRRSLVHFAFGKGAAALIGAGLLLVLVRLLDVADYGFYVASQAALELVTQVSSLGLIVVAQRYLPELRVLHQGKRLARLLAILCLGRLATLLVICSGLYLLADLIAARFELEMFLGAFRLFLLVIVVEGLARFLDEIFDSLMMQGVSQVSMLLRSGLRLGLVSVVHYGADDGLSLHAWILIECISSLLGCAWSLACLLRFGSRVRRDSPSEDDGLELRRYFKYAGPTFIAATLYTASGPNVVKLLAARLLESTQFAAFGFAAAFSAMLQRYLPMFLLIRMVRPLFVAARQREDYRTRLPSMGALVFKLNAFALAPLVSLFAVAHADLAQILTGGKYPEAGGYLLAFLLVLLAQALRAVASLTAQAMENARAPLVGTALGLVGLLFGVLAAERFGAYGLCVGLAVSEFMFALYVQRSLSSHGLMFAVDWRGYLRLLIASVVAAGVVAAVSATFTQVTLWSLALAGGLSLGVFLFVAFVFKPFTNEERDVMNRLLKREVFVW